MPFSKAPIQDTYSAQNVSLFREVSLRDGGSSGKDEDYLNVFIETVRQSATGDQRRFILKRAGTELVVDSVAASNIRGVHFWTDENKLLYAVGRDVYVYNLTSSTNTTLTNVFATSTGTVGFTEFLYDDGSVKMVASDGSATSGIVTIDTANTVVTCADADLPAHDPNICFLDGYLFVLKSSSSLVYNSELNNPLSYTVDAFIGAEQEPDKVVRIAKLNNYLVMFGTTSIEYFWDAANPAPDSPLQKNDTPIKINSYLAGFAQYGNSIYYIGSDDNGFPDVFVLKDFKIDAVGNESIIRYLSTVNNQVSTWTGNVICMQGHAFYIINAGASKTWVIDLDSKLITRFAFKNNSTFNILQSTNIFNTANTRTFFTLGNNTSHIYKFNESVYQDVGVNFTCIITTENNSFGTMNRKTMGRFAIVGDRPSSDTNILVQWSDNDYQSYNTGVSINLNQDIPSVRQMGSFRQRIFKLTYSDNYPMRIQDIEVNINKGSA